MSKKILFFSDVAYFKGGAEKSLFDLLENPSISPILAVPENGEISASALSKNIPIEIIDLGKVSNIRRPLKILPVIKAAISAIYAADKLKKSAKRHGVVCVHSNGLKAHGIACIARLLGGGPVVAHIRAIPFTRLEKLFWMLLRLINHKLVLVSRPCWPGSRLPNNANIIHNGFVPRTNTLTDIQPESPLRIGFVGRLQHIKGVELAIDWIDRARKQGMDLSLSIRGEVQADEQDYLLSLEQMVQDRELSKYCRFEGKLEGLENIYKDLDITVVPSHVPDPLPRTVMEAQGLGIPVIGFPAGGILEMIRHRETGFLAANYEEFVEAINCLTSKTETYNKIRKQALANIQENFSMENLHNLQSQIYREL